MNKRLFILVLFLFFFERNGISQSLSLDSCQAKAQKAYPLVRKYDLLESSKEYSLANAQKGYLPQVTLTGYSTYQSEVFALPFVIPGNEIEPLRNDQHNIYGEVIQPITGLFTQKNQKVLIDQSNEVEIQRLEVDLYQIRDRVNQLFFGILLNDEQIAQLELLKKDIQAGLDKTEVAIANGIALRSSADILAVELLKADQRIGELQSNRRGFVQMLSLFINEPIDENTKFETPASEKPISSINRPELRLFESQQRAIEAKSRLIANKTLPNFSLFFRGGVGAPGLNMLDNSASAYYITGLRLSWNISSFYTNNREKSILKLNQESVLVQKDAFLFNTNLSMSQQDVEILKMENMISSDNQIIQMRGRIKETTKNQLENGTATANDYLTQLNAEDQARQTQILHRVQLLLAQYNHKTITGN